jgi:prevent-host-death family protein
MDYESSDRSAREAREHFADVLNDAIRGRITWITQRGRRIAAVVPLSVAENPAGTREADQVPS